MIAVFYNSFCSVEHHAHLYTENKTWEFDKRLAQIHCVLFKTPMCYYPLMIHLHLKSPSKFV